MKTFAIKIEFDQDPVGQGLGIVEHVVNWEEFEHLKDAQARAKELGSGKVKVSIWMLI